MENDVGLLGLPHFAFLSWVHGPYKVFPLLLSIKSCRVGLLGLFPLSFFLGSIQDPFLFFVEGILPWLTLPHYPWTNVFYSLFFMDILFLWAIARPCLFTFWALGVWPYCFAFISNLSFLFLGLVWAFLPLSLCVHIIKNGYQHRSSNNPCRKVCMNGIGWFII